MALTYPEMAPDQCVTFAIRRGCLNAGIWHYFLRLRSIETSFGENRAQASMATTPKQGKVGVYVSG